MNFTTTGSVLAGTIQAGAQSVETRFEIESDADPETIKSVLRSARDGCWVRQTVAAPVTFEDAVTLNGETFEF